MKGLFPRRIQRLSYFFRLLACCCASALVGVFLGLLGHVAPAAFNSPLLKPLLWSFAIAWYCYVLGFVLAPRLRDIGISPYIALAAFMPGLNLVIGLIALFAPTGWWLRFNRPTQSAYDAMISQLRKQHEASANNIISLTHGEVYKWKSGVCLRALQDVELMFPGILVDSSEHFGDIIELSDPNTQIGLVNNKNGVGFESINIRLKANCSLKLRKDAETVITFDSTAPALFRVEDDCPVP